MVNSVMNITNPWWKESGARFSDLPAFRRSEFDTIWKRLESSNRALLLVGLRRIGKSILIKQIANELLDQGQSPPRLLYCDCEDILRLPPGKAATLTEIVEMHERMIGSDKADRFYIFDEIHASPNWPLHLKKLVDDGLRFIATDSSAAFLRETGPETGQGRWDYVDLHPWSFLDFARLLYADQPGIARLERYLLTGGYPRCGFEYKTGADLAGIWKQLREDIEESTIMRDLAEVFRIRGTPELRALHVMLSADSGALFDATSRANDIGRDRHTVTTWTEYLSRMSLLHTLPRFEKSARKSARAHPKIYATDPSLVMAFQAGPDPSRSEKVRGQAMESAVLRHLLALVDHYHGKLSFFRRGEDLEIDFVLHIRDRTIAIEVTSSGAISSTKVDRLLAASRELGADTSLLLTVSLAKNRHERANGVVSEISISEFLTEASASTPTPRLEGWLGL